MAYDKSEVGMTLMYSKSEQAGHGHVLGWSVLNGVAYVELYFPDECDIEKVPRQWIINVCAAVIGLPFKNWVYDQVQERNIEMADKREVMIGVDKEIEERFRASNHVASK